MRLGTRITGLLLLSTWLAACKGGGGDTADSGGPPGDTGAAGDTGGGALPEDMPDDPRPVELSFSGALRETLVFDSPSCTYPLGSTSFRAFWRNAEGDHHFVLVAEIIGDYTEPGTYDTSSSTVHVKLQEEAGGEGRYYSVDTSQGDTASITVEYADQDVAWGSFTFSGMHGEGGSLTASPLPVPIWCPEVN